MSNLNKLLNVMVEKNASDMHLTVGSPVRLRINGKLSSYDEQVLSIKDIEQLLKKLELL